jgi:hypothetical protein
MDLLHLIERYLAELPKQLALLDKANAAVTDPQERAKREKDARSYERRMREGFQFLGQLDDATTATLQTVREQPAALLQENAARYSSALDSYRKRYGRALSEEQVSALMTSLQMIPLSHSTRRSAHVRENGIHPASELWMTPHKSTANPMDIILGLDRYCFLTHGFTLKNFGEEVVHVRADLIDAPTTTVSSVDLFKLVLIETGRTAPCAIETKEWLGSVPAYVTQIFSGKDFWRLKAEYVLTFFAEIDSYHAFAARHFYENHAEMAPEGEYPFLGEVKVLGRIGRDDLL